MNPSNEAGGQVPAPGNSADPASAAVPPMTLPLPPTMPPAPIAAAPATGQNTPQNPLNTDVSATTQSATPQVIDDGDLIEKEWVHKAKQIVEQNRNDPHKQSEELTVFRADYMKKRYNKNIKLGE